MSSSGTAGYTDLPGNASLRQAIDHLNRIRDGHLNVTNVVTLNQSSSTTTLTNAQIGTRSALLPCPLTLHASQEIAGGALYYTNITKGSATINHANNGQTDRNFIFVVIG